MAIKHPRIDPAKLGIEYETPDQRRNRILSYQDGAQSKLDMIAEHNAREDDRRRRIGKKITEGGLWLDVRDLMGGDVGPMLREDVIPGMTPGRQRLTEDYPTGHDPMLTEYGYDEPTAPSKPQYPYPRAPRQNEPQQARALPQRRSLQEDIAPTTRKPTSGPPWAVKKFLGETRGGDTVPVWKVANQKTGSAIDKLFRIESVAHKVAMLLNESGDINDPRAVSLIASYDKRDRLLKEARQLEKTADGKPMKSERLRAVRAEINQLDYRLGI